MNAGPDPCRGDVFCARLGQPAAHEGLVLGAHRRPPVLARQAEVRGREGGLGLQVVGIGDDRVRGRQLGDRADQLPGIPHIAAEEPGGRPVAGLLGVWVGVWFGAWPRTARAGQSARARSGPLMLLGLVGEQDDLEPESGGRGKKAKNDRIGRFGRDQAEPH